MDWANADARDVVLAICGHWRLEFAQAEDYLLARQLQEAEEQGAGGAKPCSIGSASLSAGRGLP
jgi:hypothetical protein